MSSALNVPVPLVGTAVKRIVIELQATAVVDQYRAHLYQEGLDDKSWEFIHKMLGYGQELALQMHTQACTQQAVMGMVAHQVGGVKQ